MKRLKYLFKGLCLARWPGLYWAARELVKGRLEPELQLIEPLCPSGGTFLDVGANWGAYSFYAIRAGRTVHAFEPQPRLAGVLARGLGGKGLQIHNTAVSDGAGSSELRVPRNDIGYSTIELANRLEGTADLRRGIETSLVATVRLDDLALGPVSLLKIDVEGHEGAVLAGARALLERDVPSLIVEVEDRHKQGARGAVCEFLAGFGYACFVYEAGRLHPQAALQSSRRNLIFIHPKRRAAIAPALFADVPALTASAPVAVS